MATRLPINATENVTDGYTLFKYINNDASGGKFMPSILFTLFIILFVMMKGFMSTAKAFVGTSFICMVSAIMLTTLGFLSSTYMYITILMVAIGAVWAYLEDRIE
jgi:hypothetical protein